MITIYSANTSQNKIHCQTFQSLCCDPISGEVLHYIFVYFTTDEDHSTVIETFGSVAILLVFG